ncbi:MAG: ABC transporter permease, partial [Gemmatimonadetes bacterium]|nr:ABC transporter permease [Gemmatimonadota bacterium]
MSDGPAARLSAILARGVYRLLLLRYDRRLRRTYGREMEDAFLRLLHEARLQRGLRGWVRVWLWILGETVRPLPGPVQAAPASIRPTRLTRPPMGALSRILLEVRAAVRTLRRAPGFTALITGILGVAVAFNGSAFAVVQAYLLRSLPYPDVDRIVTVSPATSAVGWKNSSDVFEKAVSWNLDGFTLVGGGPADVVLGAWVSPDFFDVLGVRPMLGRTFTDDDVDARVAVISHNVWMSRFGGDPGVGGKTLSLYPSDGRAGELYSFTVIGVLPSDFWYLNGYTDVLVPLASPGPVYMGRLRSDVPPAQAAVILTERARAARAGEEDASVQVRVRRLRATYTATVRRRLEVVQATALLVLLVACVNAALLLLLRAEVRKREIGVRRALGAGGTGLALQSVTEGLLLAAAAGGLGLVLSAGALAGLGDLVVTRLGRSLPGGAGALHVSAWLVLVTSGVCALVGVGFGSVPLWTVLREDTAGLLGGGGRGSTASVRSGRIRGALVTAEVALSLTLLTGGALLVRSSLHLEGTRLGFRPDGLTAFTVGLTSEGSTDRSHRIVFFE